MARASVQSGFSGFLPHRNTNRVQDCRASGFFGDIDRGEPAIGQGFGGPPRDRDSPYCIHLPAGLLGHLGGQYLCGSARPDRDYGDFTFGKLLGDGVWRWAAGLGGVNDRLGDTVVRSAKQGRQILRDVLSPKVEEMCGIGTKKGRNQVGHIAPGGKDV